MSLLYHVNMYLEFLILACTIYILASVYAYGVDDSYVDTAIALEEFMVEEDILPGGQSIPFADYHDFSVLREVTPDSYTAKEEY